MSKYSTIHTSNGFAEGTIIKNDSGKYFGGYDFMGSVNWLETNYDAVLMDDDEAEQIISDLEAADEPDEPEEPKDMKRIDVLRALAAAHSAFRNELEKHGIKMSDYHSDRPYTLYIDNGPTKPITILGEYDYKQKVSENLH